MPIWRFLFTRDTHFGAWQQWDEVEARLIGKQIYIEISFALDYLATDKAKKLFESHPADFLLFGTDSPWRSQKETLNLLNRLKLDTQRMDKILRGNAKNLLGTN